MIIVIYYITIYITLIDQLKVILLSTQAIGIMPWLFDTIEKNLKNKAKRMHVVLKSLVILLYVTI